VTTFVHDGAQVIDEYEAPRFTAVTLGTPMLVGTSTVASNGTVTLIAGGDNIYGTADQGRYTYAMLSGNGTISAKITSQTNTHVWANAGLMLRDGTAANAMHASIFVTPGKVVTFQRRTTTGGTSTETAIAGVTAPQWLSLTRSGNTVTAKSSPDGITWTTVGSATFTMPTTLTAGVAATSHNADLACTVTYTNLAITGNASTVASPVLARRYVYGSYVDEALALINSSGKYYYHANHLYSVAALTNQAGAVVERYRYSAYGNRTVLAADGVTTRAASNYGQQVGFTGRYLDKETGLWYFRARYYSGSLGSFIGRDPLTYVDGMSLYGAYYVPNGLDPSGEKSKKVGTIKGKFSQGWEVDVYFDDENGEIFLDGPLGNNFFVEMKLVITGTGCFDFEIKIDNVGSAKKKGKLENTIPVNEEKELDLKCCKEKITVIGTVWVYND
jgi:RHS repeat-associated protein